MKTFILLLTASLSLGQVALSWAAATTPTEQELIAVLQSSATPRDKDAACAALKRVGTARSIPSLANLLTDEKLSHSARYALEPMSAPEAGQALIDALPRTQGLTKVGIISSIGLRRESGAVRALVKTLSDKDPDVAEAAAKALGQISGAEALKGLQKALKSADAAQREELEDAVVMAASRMARDEQSSGAVEALRRMAEAAESHAARTAAYRAMILTAREDKIALLEAGLRAEPGAKHSAAMRLIHEPDQLRLHQLADILSTMVSQLSSLDKVSALDALAHLKDPAAAPALVALTSNHPLEVRVAALNALGALGGAAAVPLLAEKAATCTGPEQAAARQALLMLDSRGEATQAIVANLGPAQPPVQAELARALGERGDTTAVPSLLKLAAQGNGTTATAAFQALALLAGQAELPALTTLVAMSATDQLRNQAAEALNTSVQRLLTANGNLDPGFLVTALRTRPLPTQLALLPIASGIPHPEVRAALRSALESTDAQLQQAAIRAVCDTVDPELLPEVLRLAKESRPDNLRGLAIRALVRLLTQEERTKLPTAERIAALKAVLESSPAQGGAASPLGAAPTTDQIRVLLAGLGELPSLESLRAVEPLLDNTALQAEAARAVLKIAPVIAESREALAALKKASATSGDASLQQQASQLIATIEARSDYVTSWMVAGPYSESGKNFAALFDTPFPPESETEAAPASAWRALAPSTDPKRIGAMDLLAALGGEQRVAYARTWIHSETETPVVLEMGSDDGIKVWVNGQLVHANNTARPLAPESDKAKAVLKQGWNKVMFKVTQNNLGWEFTLRFRKPDGARLDTLRFDASHQP